jgi:hypothetical protein
MGRRTIQSPGVEVRESDLSLRTVSQGTTTYIAGFANSGPTDEVVGVTSITDFEQIFGAPTTPAERYFYHSVRAALNSTGRVLVNRLPYGENTGAGFGSKISVLAYPASGFSGDTTTNNFELTGTWFIGKPKQFEIDQEQYLQLKSGQLFTSGWSSSASPASNWDSISSLSSAAMIVINKGQTVIDGRFNGYYIGIADNTNINPASAYDAIRSVQTVSQSAGTTGLSSYIQIPSSRFEFALTATPEFGENPAVGSISQVMEDRITNYSIANTEFNDTLNIGVFRLRQSVFSKDANRLDYVLEEGFNGSIGYYRQRNSENGGAPINFFLENVENDSRNIDILVNPYLSDQIKGIQLDSAGNPLKRIRVVSKTLEENLSGNASLSAAVGVAKAQFDQIKGIGFADSLFPLGAYGEVKLDQKSVGKLPEKLDRALTRIKNAEKFNIDIICEAGLGTIHTYLETSSLSADGFDDTKTTSAIEALRTSNELDATGQEARNAYTTIFNKFATFCGPVKDGGRGDVLFVADPLRQILVSGKKDKVQQDKTKNFYTDIYWAMRHQFENVNTSYACVFANWMLVYDNYTGLFTYVPSSGYAAAKMASVDADVGPWGAPAGFNRGVITDASDVALSPNQRQRDDLYTVNLNPIATFQDRGNVFFGQKTLLKKPSAFDRINVRRTFLYLEKITKSTMEFFLFENNTLFTRTRVVNTLTPFFERVKADDGLYDYLIVCDERNNTPEVIDQNELVVDVYLKPVRTAEFILVNFYATRTDTNFEELIGG